MVSACERDKSFRITWMNEAGDRDGSSILLARSRVLGRDMHHVRGAGSIDPAGKPGWLHPSLGDAVRRLGSGDACCTV
jgi:hypothetical protein